MILDRRSYLGTVGLLGLSKDFLKTGQSHTQPSNSHSYTSINDTNVFEKVFDFEDIDEPNSIDNNQSWQRQAGSCCDGAAGQLGTLRERKAADKQIPQKTLESEDYTEPYYRNIGGNFMIQRSGGYGEFYSEFWFSNHLGRYPAAPYQPDKIRIRVGGNDHEEGFNGLGYIELRDTSKNNFARFEFPQDDGQGEFKLNDHTIVSDRTNGLYEVYFQNINWDYREYDVTIYQQSLTEYENYPIYSEKNLSFHNIYTDNFDSIKTYVIQSGGVYLDSLTLSWDTPTPTSDQTLTDSPTPNRSATPPTKSQTSDQSQVETPDNSDNTPRSQTQINCPSWAPFLLCELQLPAALISGFAALITIFRWVSSRTSDS